MAVAWQHAEAWLQSGAAAAEVVLQALLACAVAMQGSQSLALAHCLQHCCCQPLVTCCAEEILEGTPLAAVHAALAKALVTCAAAAAAAAVLVVIDQRH